MTLQVGRQTPSAVPGRWHARTAEDVATALGVDPRVGLDTATAAQRLRDDGPNALPEEKQLPGWRRFLDEYRSYMQLILIGAAIVSLIVQEWGTTVLLLALTVLNAVIGLRQRARPRAR